MQPGAPYSPHRRLLFNVVKGVLLPICHLFMVAAPSREISLTLKKIMITHTDTLTLTG